MTLRVTPEVAAVGAGYQVRLTGCAEQPSVSVQDQFSDGVWDLVLPDAEGGGTWSCSAGRVGTADLLFRGGQPCGASTSLEARIDVENPQLVRQPFDGDGWEGLTGTDCPAGTEATVEVSHGGVVDVHQRPIDAYGDWTFDLTTTTSPGDVTVTASCGSVTYDASTYVVADGAEPPVVPPSQPPAAPVPGPARFTG